MKLVERSLYSPKPWLIFDGDISWSRARFTEFNEAGQYVPEAVDAVVSGGASIDNFHRTFASLRLRYFGPRALIEDNSVQSKATTLLNFEGGYQFAKALRLNAQVYNLLDATHTARQHGLWLLTRAACVRS